ncbi:GlsB/YeaQ/YmgE family stress response membrane protein [Phreatobacter sp. HK31-P]
MAIESLLILILVGAIAGWLAGIIVKGFGFGLVGNIVVGILGALIATWLFPRLGVSIGSGLAASIVSATIGAVILLVIVGVVRRA